MKIIRDLASCPSDCRGAAVALGNFDGVHLGHQAILRKTMDIARKSGVPAAVMTFEPHPREFFTPGKKLRIYPLHKKLALLRELGIDLVFLARFNRYFAALAAQDFITLLQESLAVSHVVTGRDFAFGKGRRGDTALLSAEAKRRGFGFTTCPPVLDAGGEVISSSAIRTALADGNVGKAAAMLGRPYSIEGRVRYGEQRGRTLGFPTANLSVAGLFLPRFGIYAVRAGLGSETHWHGGVASLGVKPTFGTFDPLLEVHLFAMTGSIYGTRLRVEFSGFIRDEKRFDNGEALRQQMELDCTRAKEMLHAGQ